MRVPYNQNVIGVHRVLIMLYNRPSTEGKYTCTTCGFSLLCIHGVFAVLAMILFSFFFLLINSRQALVERKRLTFMIDTTACIHLYILNFRGTKVI